MASFQQVRFREESPVGLVGAVGVGPVGASAAWGSRKTSTPSATWRDPVDGGTGDQRLHGELQVFDARAAQSRKRQHQQARLPIGEQRILRHRAHRLPHLLAAELVRLGHHDDQRDVRRRPAEQLAIEVGELAAGVDHQHDTGERDPAGGCSRRRAPARIAWRSGPQPRSRTRACRPGSRAGVRSARHPDRVVPAGRRRTG